MISLMALLAEAIDTPKAVILAGAPGAGKSYITKQVFRDNDISVLNIDNTYIDLLKQSGVSLDLKRANAQARSDQATAMQQAQKQYKAQLDTAIQSKGNIAIDGTAASLKKTQELKSTLEGVGYKVMMVYVFASLEKSLAQNEDRFERSQGADRSLPPGIVFQTWNNVTKNFFPYQQLFGDKFVAVVNDDEPFSNKGVEDIVQRYLTPYNPQDIKPKTDKQQAKSNERKTTLKSEVESFLTANKTQEIIDNSYSKEEAVGKIDMFLSL